MVPIIPKVPLKAGDSVSSHILDLTGQVELLLKGVLWGDDNPDYVVRLSVRDQDSSNRNRIIRSTIATGNDTPSMTVTVFPKAVDCQVECLSGQGSFSLFRVERELPTQPGPIIGDQPGTVVQVGEDGAFAPLSPPDSPDHYLGTDSDSEFGYWPLPIISGPPGSQPISWNETPGGQIDGVVDTFSLLHRPVNRLTIMLFKSGLLMKEGNTNDYVVDLDGQTITYDPLQVPLVGESHVVTYAYLY